ncbi:tripartite ATP-independent transporter DctP family solute receptor [Actinoplanes lutulentus]|uniref:Tripartite ATP-independent transporter DctP family solute receptor n=1 Tax=Actinoplanes lutulentus TaxID=1287878 RepID=A0A327YXR3_9ACTN|nr:TRAP transporter substrate-binding protein DctP [Actinoplanes lutulentus]MBB2946553.1 tripartite ATP-independent transporter DctP family solute receptor [Actinoplanes lutulentus]RAK26471.1 tripartite ATP-independent transporter DctP family solute receptor [Actinoplanes lutulentus]
MHQRPAGWRRITAALTLPITLVLAAGCSTSSNAPTTEGENPTLTIKIGSSQPESQPNYYCGMKLLKERVEAQNLGLTIDMFPNSQLGPDAERYAGVQSGDIDIDLQGGSAMSTAYPQIGVLDAAYAFNDVDHFFKWVDQYGKDFFTDFNAATDTTIVDAWYFGMRTFTATKPIRKPADLAGQKIRFPNTPQFLANAEALGADAVAIAVEELYLALQQGIAQGQENPVVATHAQKFDEILKVASLTNHQVGTHYVVVSDKTLDKMSQPQKDALFKAIHDIRAENRKCVDDETEKVLDGWRGDSTRTVVEIDQIDREAFISKAEAFFNTHFKGENLELYKSVRASA